MDAPSKTLTGRVALITGAARGVGREISLALARAGADIVLVDRCASPTSTLYGAATPDDLSATRQMVEDIGCRALALQADVTRLADLTAAVDRTLAALGRLDILVPNAGIFTWGRLWELSEEQWDETIDINLKGAWLTMKAAVPHMIARRHGRIIAIASTAGLRGGVDIAHYAASKHGVVGLVRSLAMEVGPFGITVNALCPSRMETTMVTYERYYERFAGVGASREEMDRFSRQDHVLPIDYLPVRAVAEGVVWLASDSAAFVTGVVLPVDAGEMLV